MGPGSSASAVEIFVDTQTSVPGEDIPHGSQETLLGFWLPGRAYVKTAGHCEWLRGEGQADLGREHESGGSWSAVLNSPHTEYPSKSSTEKVPTKPGPVIIPGHLCHPDGGHHPRLALLF